MTINQMLSGKSIMVMTDMGVEVKMLIKSVRESRHTEQITPDTPENDWWGESRNWSTYIVTFDNGHTKEYDSLDEINIL